MLLVVGRGVTSRLDFGIGEPGNEECDHQCLDQASQGSSGRGSSIEELLREWSIGMRATTNLLETQLRRELYLQAAELIKEEFRADSWQAFELSVAGEFTIEQVAEQLWQERRSNLYRSQPNHVSTPRDHCRIRGLTT